MVTHRNPMKYCSVLMLLAFLGAACQPAGTAAAPAPTQAALAPTQIAPAATLPSPTAGAETTLQRIKREGIIRVGFNGEDPYDFIDTNGNLVGEDIDVIKAALAAAGVDVKVEGILGEWTGLIPGLLANRWDVIGAGMFTLPSRCAQAAFANPDYSVGIAMAVKKGNPLNLHSYDDLLANPKVRISASPAGAETIYGKNIGIPDSQFVFSPDTPTCVAALQAGRADVVISEELGLSTVLKKLNDPTIEFVTMSHQPKGSPGYGAMVFRKEDSDLRQLYNTGLAILLSNGQLAAIYDKYGLPHSMLPDPKVTAEQICAGGS